MAGLELCNPDLMQKNLRLSVPVGVSNRHVHLSSGDMEELFGRGYQLQVLRPLSQPDEFAAREVLTIVGPRGVIEGVRVMGPIRDATQVEITMTDGYRLGLRPPVRHSGDLDQTPGIAVVGLRGVVNLPRGVILAARHIHINDVDAKKAGLMDGQKVMVRTRGVRAQIMENVLVRVEPNWVLEMHLDTDEANAALLAHGDRVDVLTDSVQYPDLKIMHD